MLKAQLKGIKVIHNPLLAERTTMHLGGRTIAEIVVEDDAEVEYLPDLVKTFGAKVAFLGEGSNILASDEKLPLVLIRRTSTTEPKAELLKNGDVRVYVQAGVRLPSLLAFLAKHELAGMEGLCGIPGSVGGAVAMNAGSYGVDIAQVLEFADVFSPSLGKQRVYRKDFEFTYRHLALQATEEEFLILGAAFILKKGSRQNIRELMRGFYLQKQKTQPVTAWSAGCAFKNPVPGVSAGKLIDEAGLRGAELGGMALSKIHANFLVNLGNGSFSAAMEILELAKSRVFERTGHRLTLEIKLWA